MKPVIIECRGMAFCAMDVRALHSNGRRLHVVYRSDKPPYVEDRVFEWPWKVQLGSDCNIASPEEPVF